MSNSKQEKPTSSIKKQSKTGAKTLEKPMKLGLKSPRSLRLTLDTKTIAALVKTADGPTLSRLYKTYWKTAYNLLEDMHMSIKSGDRSQLQKAAHNLKGSSINVGLPLIAEMSAQLQNARPTDTLMHLEQIESQMPRTRKILIRHLKRIRPAP